MKINLELFFYLWSVVQININKLYGLVRCSKFEDPEILNVSWIVLGAFTAGVGFGGLVGLTLMDLILEYYLEYLNCLELNCQSTLTKPCSLVNSLDEDYNQEKVSESPGDRRNLRVWILIVLFCYAWNHNIARCY